MCYQIWLYSISALDFLFKNPFLPLRCFPLFNFPEWILHLFLSPPPPPPRSDNQCFMDRLCLWTKTNFISLWSACLVSVISAFETQCGFLNLVWGSLDFCMCPVDAHKECTIVRRVHVRRVLFSFTMLSLRYADSWFSDSVQGWGTVLHFLIADYLLSWIKGHW